MNIYIYDDKKGKTEIIEIEDSKIESNPDLEFFNDNDIRKVWHSSEEEWYLSIVDVVRFLTDSTDPKQYIKKMRLRDGELSSQVGYNLYPTSNACSRRKNEKNTGGQCGGNFTYCAIHFITQSRTLKEES